MSEPTSPPAREPAAPAPGLTVCYDGACPLCRREIAVYRGLRASVPLRWADVADPAEPLPGGADRAALTARFHVRSDDGRWWSGAAAFVQLWSVLPGWRWLARVPGALPLLELGYRGFLRLRPPLQSLARRLEGRGATTAPEKTR